MRDEAFFSAIRVGNLSRVKTLFSNILDIDYGMYLAIKHGKLAIAEFLMGHCDKNKALDSAACCNNIEAIKMFLANGAKIYDALCTAVENENDEIVNLLLSHSVGSKTSDSSAIETAAYSGRVDYIDLFIASNMYDAAAYNAALQDGAEGDITEEIVDKLLKHGADIDANDGAALRNAAYERNTRMVKLLLSRGAKLGYQKTLQYLLDSKHADVAKLLIDKGATIGEDELNAAVRSGSAKIMKFLLAEKISSDQIKFAATHAAQYDFKRSLMPLIEHLSNDELELILCEAAFQGSVKVVKLLLHKGVNFRVHDNAPLGGALKARHRQVAKMFISGYTIAELKELNIYIKSGILDHWLQCLI